MTKVAIGAVMKQEAPYILEWVAYHKALGFELIIADNGGTDNTSKILTALDAADVITRIDVRYLRKSPQIPAYRAIMRVARKMKVDIIGFLDCDEFFARRVPITKLTPDEGAGYIASEFRKFDASQISYYWLIYGSKTDFQDITVPVLERFSYHVTTEAKLDKKISSFKSFVKVNEMFKLSNIFFLGPQIMSPHVFDGAMRKWIIDYKRADPYSFNPKIREVSHHSGVILHFIIKTWEEYQSKKMRGSAIYNRSRCDDEFFDRHDLNDSFDPIGSEALSKLHSKIYTIKNAIDGFEYQEQKARFFNSLRVRLLSIGWSKFKHRKKYKKFRRKLSKQKILMSKKLSTLLNHISKRH
ncbi:MAG: glycosyltransferase family 2 protein [Candidatus Marinimicrobia bacterium]|nr:glycosyltransferase family 2 protein [Candidatus Neomarinimicrobiota bacterium]